MKVVIAAQQEVQVHLTCKTCSKDYSVSFEEMGSIPLWNYESCSRECAEVFSKNKFVTLKKQVLTNSHQA